MQQEFEIINQIGLGNYLSLKWETFWANFREPYINPDYVDWVNIVCSIIGTICGLLVIHFAFFFIVGVFAKRRYPETDKKLKYGIIIPTRNEATVIGNLIDSIKKNNYPQDKLTIFVVAHNCTDKTAKIGREHGATVYEYNNPNECTKGYALKYLFNQINKDYGTQNFDGFMVLDADNILDVDYISKMNDAFVDRGQKCTITSYRHSKNFGANPLSACYGIYWLNGCRAESRGRTVLGCSTRVPGTGFIISSHVVKDGWKYVTLTEDWEFSADRIIEGEKIYYCDDAIFYDEQPTKLKIMWRQRVRWSRGHLLVCVTRFWDLLKGIFVRKNKDKPSCRGSMYDMMSNVFPSTLVNTIISFVKFNLYLLAPLFVKDLDFGGLMKQWAIDTLMGYLGLYIGCALLAIFIYILERKRIKNVSFGIKLLSILLFPIFTIINTFIVIVALFSKNLKWKTIPHTDTTDFNQLNETEAETKAKEVTEKVTEGIEQ